MDDGELSCECPQDFLGAFCDSFVQRTRAPGSGPSAAAIIIPLVVILLVFFAGGVFFFVLRKRPL